MGKGIHVVWLKRCCFAVVLGLWASISVADVRQALAALQAGNWTEALRLADTIDPRLPFDRAMIIARAKAELGDLDGALQAAETAKALRPSDSGARALEGLILARQGQNTTAMIALRRSLDLARTPQEKALARQFLRQVQAQNPWRLTGSFGIAPSNNINKATTATSILVNNIFGSGTVLTPLSGGQAVSGNGVALSFNLSRTWARPDRSAWTFGLGAAAKLYEEHDFDEVTKSANLAYQFAPTRRTVSTLSYRYADKTYGKSDFSITQSLDYTLRQQLAPLPGQGPHGLTWSLGYDDQERFDNALRDNTTRRAGLTYFWTPTPTMQWTLGVQVEDRTSQANDIASDRVSVNLGVKAAPGGGPWVIEAKLTQALGRWDRRELLFPEVREDNETSLEVSLQNNNISYFGLTPTISVTRLERASNLGLYDISSTDVFLGVSNAF